jgi:ABC-2 type transport system ATP-binding protein
MTAIDIADVIKRFGKTKVLHGITLQVRPGEIIGLVGPSGCGKTTLVDLIVGLTVPDSGSVWLDGERAPYKTVRRTLGFMPQETALYEDISADDNVIFFGSLYGMTRREIRESSAWAMSLARLQEEGGKLVKTFSGGMKRRLSLAIALLDHPKILVMDEPTVGLDPVHREALWESFRSLAAGGSALLVTTHVMDEAMRCDQVAMMREGHLVCCDAPASIIARAGASTLEEAFITLVSSESGEAAYHA